MYVLALLATLLNNSVLSMFKDNQSIGINI